MSQIARAWGIGRSLAMYHLIPFRQRRLRHLYSRFVVPGDLVFDVGAHVGNRTRALAALGCRVVAVEPQADFALLLRTLFVGAAVTVVEAAAAEASGRRSLAVSERTPTVSTTRESWRKAISRQPGFDRVRWSRTVDVDATTIDQLIERFGLPAFVKIDVEGSEPQVLDGLSCAVPVLSFEYLPGLLELVERSTARLSTLGAYVFNWSPGESYRLAERSWLSAADLMGALSRERAQRSSGDVYAAIQTEGLTPQKFTSPQETLSGYSVQLQRPAADAAPQAEHEVRRCDRVGEETSHELINRTPVSRRRTRLGLASQRAVGSSRQWHGAMGAARRWPDDQSRVDAHAEPGRRSARAVLH